MPSIIQEERRLTHGTIHCVIGRELGKTQYGVPSRGRGIAVVT